MTIKCKIDCQVVDCKECAEALKEGQDEVQEWKENVAKIEDKEDAFMQLQVLMFLRENVLDDLISFSKNRLHELGVTIPEEEGKNENKV